MHVNFGIMEPLAERVRNKRDRYAAYAARGAEALAAYRALLVARGLMPGGPATCADAPAAGPSQGASRA